MNYQAAVSIDLCNYTVPATRFYGYPYYMTLYFPHQ